MLAALRLFRPSPVLATARRFSAAASLCVPQTDVSTLPSGLRVASETLPGETATVGVYINAGSRFEQASNNGVAHFLEHITFKGTPSLSQRSLELAFEDMGGHLNAYTSREHTVYFAKVLKKDISRAVQILGDILTNSNLDSGAIEAERSTIIREMEEVESIMEELVFDQLHATAYQTSSLGRTILGPKENILSIKRDDLVNYVQTHYTAPRVILAGAGAVDHAELVGLAEKHLSGFKPATDATNIDKLREPARFVGSEIRWETDIPLAHTAIAVEGPSWTSPDIIAFLVMQVLLGSWNRTSSSGKNLSSRMCQKIAEQGLAHSVTAFNSPYHDTGLFGVYATAEPGRLDDLMFEVMSAWVRLCFEVSPVELQRAKNQLKTSLLMELDGTTPVCEEIGRQMLTFGRRIPVSELFARIDSVTEKTITECGQKYIYDRDPVVAAIGPVKSLSDYNKLRRWTYWLRT